MTITLNNIGKRYNREWIFRKVNYNFESGKKYAITGANGSGKSTLLQCIAGSTQHTEGTINFNTDQQVTNNEKHYEHIAIAAPYLNLVEEMTATEFLQFHCGFKTLIQPLNSILEKVQLQQAANKQIRYYSSGMKQRLKLAQAFYSNVPIILLDEPTTNLDADGIALYHLLIKECTSNKLLIISSNDKQEYNFCDKEIKVEFYK